MAMPRPSHLALVGLAFLHLLAHATTGEHLLTRSPMNTTTATFFIPHTSILLLASNTPAAAAGWPTSSRPLQASPSQYTLSGLSPLRHLDVSTGTDARDDNASAPATTTTTPPAPPCPRSCGVNTRDAALVDTLLTPVGINTAPSKKAALALLNALPLLAIPFLPPPLAALVALSTLMVTPVRACSVPSASCSGLAHATCTVYRYLHDNGTVDRAQPFAELRAVCLHPLCNAGTYNRALSTTYGRCNGRFDDPFHGYCSVRTLEAEALPEGNSWHIMPVQLPIADPDAVAAGGGDVCYVELEHMSYREGYYIRCPVRDGSHVPVLRCTEFPHDAVVAAVWEHRRLTYSDTVEWYTDYTAKTKLEGLEDRMTNFDRLVFLMCPKIDGYD